jgi:hypothetical protein
MLYRLFFTSGDSKKFSASRTTSGSGEDAKEPTKKRKICQVPKISHYLQKIVLDEIEILSYLTPGLFPGSDQFPYIFSGVIHSQLYLICSLSASEQHMQPTVQ